MRRVVFTYPGDVRAAWITVLAEDVPAARDLAEAEIRKESEDSLVGETDEETIEGQRELAQDTIDHLRLIEDEEFLFPGVVSHDLGLDD